MGHRTTAAAAILSGALLAASGCDATAGGPATPETTASTNTAAPHEHLWDPCSINDDLLRQVGVDPATRDDTISGVEDVDGWKLCSWQNKPSRSDYKLGVWSTIHTLEELKGDANNIGFTDILVSGRSGAQFRKAHDAYNSVCYVGFPYSGGTLEISVTNSPASGISADPCQTANSAAEILVPQLPK